MTIFLNIRLIYFIVGLDRLCYNKEQIKRHGGRSGKWHWKADTVPEWVGMKSAASLQLKTVWNRSWLSFQKLSLCGGLNAILGKLEL